VRSGWQDGAMNDWLPPTRTRPNTPAVLTMVALICLPEVLFLIAESRFLGTGGPRNWAIVHFGFWNALLAGAQPIYPFQRELMFVSYAFLHGGFLHLAGNMAITLALAGIVVARSSDLGFVVLFLFSAIGGGIGYAALGPLGAPMVGASGAVFGLVGAWKYWEWVDRRALGAPMKPLWMSLFGLALLNLVLWYLLGGLLAWQAHLGGFLAGAAWAAAVAPSASVGPPRKRPPQPRQARDGLNGS
jgi:membrane associated rhomboid family serine protease